MLFNVVLRLLQCIMLLSGHNGSFGFHQTIDQVSLICSEENTTPRYVRLVKAYFGRTTPLYERSPHVRPLKWCIAWNSVIFHLKKVLLITASKIEILLRKNTFRCYALRYLHSSFGKFLCDFSLLLLMIDSHKGYYWKMKPTSSSYKCYNKWKGNMSEAIMFS